MEKIQKFLSVNSINSLTIALLCTMWITIGNVIGLFGWAIFSGCTAYFIDNSLKKEYGLIIVFCSTFLGSTFALISLSITDNMKYLSIPLVFLTTFLMCYLGKHSIFRLVPGSFIGSFSIFASGENFVVVFSICFGILLGYICKNAMIE